MKKKSLIIAGVLIIIVCIAKFLYTDFTNPKDVIAIVNNKTYSIYQFQKEYDVKVLNYDSKKVRVSNGETYYDCYYNDICEIWPNSRGGMVMYEAPLVDVIFKKS